ncbi:MAG: UDP-N-acetylmuramate dehydrogenase [Actinomycetales bacterium]|nr:MAG: UDP-N-acetylmuramate dehydrogenase [Actinomycetales bacterium]
MGPGSFAEHTSLRVGGAVGTWIVARTEAACIEAIVECDDLGRPALLLGGGSNVVCSDAAFDGTVVQVAPTGITLVDHEGRVRIVAAAGEEWDELVLRSLAAGSAALAPLSGIPGLVGASPIQNVGAYGAEVSDYLVSVRVWDRTGRSVQELSAQECGFGYRTSRFKHEPDRFVVLEVVFDLPVDESVCVTYPQLAGAVGVEVGVSADGVQVREAVLELRRSKGMVLDEYDPDTWSVGSFFVNPIVSDAVARTLPDECPRFPTPSGEVKVSAAWLIAASGIDRGFQLPESSARVSTKHTLAISNAGSATCEDVIELARWMRSRVVDTFGVELGTEPRLVGCSL